MSEKVHIAPQFSSDPLPTANALPYSQDISIFRINFFLQHPEVAMEGESEDALFPFARSFINLFYESENVSFSGKIYATSKLKLNMFNATVRPNKELSPQDIRLV